jgi:hypothetical protein
MDTDRYDGPNIKFTEIEEKNVDEIGGEGKKKIPNSSGKYARRKSNFIDNKNSDNLIEISNKPVKIDFIDKKESNKNLVITNNISNVKNNFKKEKAISQNNNNNISNKNKKNQIEEFPYEDISNLSEDDNKKYNLPDVEVLRKEIEESLIKKEEEKIRIKKEEEKEKKLQRLMIDKKNIKLFDSNKLTFDSNGKIISFKQYKTDNLKDFLLTKNFIKENKKIDNLNISKKKLKNINNQISKEPIQILKTKEEEIIKQNQNQNQNQNPFKITIDQLKKLFQVEVIFN